jgi:hypothetical protein
MYKNNPACAVLQMNTSFGAGAIRAGAMLLCGSSFNKMMRLLADQVQNTEYDAAWRRDEFAIKHQFVFETAFVRESVNPTDTFCQSQNIAMLFL